MVTLEMRLDMEFSESVWQEQLTKYREIVDYSPLEIFEAELITGQLTYANRAAQQTLGYTREEMQRLKVVDLLADGSKHLFAEIQANILVNGIKEAISEYKIKTKVLLNLFVNAVEAMPMGGELSIQTRNVPANKVQDTLGYSVPFGYVCLEVSDTGIGMDPPTLKRVFEPFFTTKEIGHGTGLGLASVHGIVKNHNGLIDVVSEKGTGTTFRVFFPAQPHATIEVYGSKD
jgi:two-component system cell cycle sensor histidine kinase/response regulator CckA